MKQLLITLLMILVVGQVIGQKMSKKPLVISYNIDPEKPIEESLKRYDVTIKTPLDPLSWSEEVEATGGIKDSDKRQAALKAARARKLERYGSSYLSIEGGKFLSVKSEPDFQVLLETSQADVTELNQKPISEIANDEIVYRYSFSAKLTLTDKSGNVLFEGYVHKDEEEQKMIKSELLLNPTLKLKMGLAKNNPEKQKKLIQRRIDKAGHYILEETMLYAQEVMMNNFGTPYLQSSLAVFGVKGKSYSDLADANENLMKKFAGFRALSKKKRLPKSDVDDAFIAALPVWQKYIDEKGAEIDEKALKGLKLNCVVAYCWLGQVEKAGVYIEQIPEAIPNDIGEKDEDVEISNGTMMTFDFTGYARNTRDFYDRCLNAGDRVRM